MRSHPERCCLPAMLATIHAMCSRISDTNTTSQITPASTAASSIDFFPTLSTSSGNYISRGGFSEYNGLQFGAERRFSAGLSFTANMTWSKCLGDIHDLLDNDIGGYRAPYVPGMGHSGRCYALQYSMCAALFTPAEPTISPLGRDVSSCTRARHPGSPVAGR